MDAGELAHNLRELIELDRAFGVEFIPRPPSAQQVSPTVAPRTAPQPAPTTRTEPERAAPALAAPPSRVSAPTSAPVARAAKPVADPLPAVIPAPAGDSLAAVATEVATCTRCGLCATRTTTVPGEGNPQPELMFIGEGPGAEEDLQGRPFVGPAGQLLDKMIAAMGFSRADVLIANVVKCRPPANRTPLPEEIAACLPYLHRQIQAAHPRIICTLGNVPLRALFGAEQPGITKVRGQRLTWNGITVIPTFHPSYLLRNASAKKPCWEDLLVVLSVLGRKPPERKN